jgi:[acyl-carrier-protein] S-malonyltransferase
MGRGVDSLLEDHVDLMKFAFVFPGQGSQSVGMMNAYGEHPIVRQTFDEASAALGRDLWQLAADGPADALSQTVNTQPLMLTAGVAVFRLWCAKGGRIPDMVAGHSLGEYSALVAAEVLSLRVAAPLVEIRARAMQDAVPAGVGAMAAILGLDRATIESVCAEVAHGQVVAAVNFNAPEQTVIAGHKDAVERAAEELKAKGAKRAIMLPVSAPFHCRLMQPAAEKLQAHLRSLVFGEPKIPLLNNVDVSVETDPLRIKDALVRQAASPVRWVEIMQAMQQADISRIFECGPGKVLSGLVKRCADNLNGAAMADLAGIEAGLAAVAG